MFFIELALPPTGPGTSYGHQIWVGCRALQTDFCFVGFGGLSLIFSTTTHKAFDHHAACFSTDIWQTPKVMGQPILSLVNGK